MKPKQRLAITTAMMTGISCHLGIGVDDDYLGRCDEERDREVALSH